MQFLLNTPRRAWPLATVASVMYALSPVIMYLYYASLLDADTFPTNADSIGIPIFFGLATIVCLVPVFILLLYLALRHYRGRVPIWAWNRERLAWSWTWTVLFGLLALVVVQDLVVASQLGIIYEVLYDGIWLCLLVLFRATVVAKSNKSLNLTAPVGPAG